MTRIKFFMAIIASAIVFFCAGYFFSEKNILQKKELFGRGPKSEAENVLLGKNNSAEKEIDEILRRSYLAKAKIQLQEIKTEGINELKEYHIDNMYKHLDKASATLEDIGTTEKEIKDIMVDNYISLARFELAEARTGTDDMFVEMHVNSVMKYVKKAGASLDRLGISDKELANIIQARYIATAKRYLELARSSDTGDGAEASIYFLRENMRKADASLDKIGSSEDELVSIIKKARASEAQAFLDKEGAVNPHP